WVRVLLGASGKIGLRQTAWGRPTASRNTNMAERALVTGGSRFVGSCLVRDLIGDGFDVHLLLRPGHHRWRLADLGGRFTPQWADLRDSPAVRQAVARCRPDIIYHLAAHGTLTSRRDRTAVLSTNLLGTVNLL